MLRKVKRALVESYVGAIGLGFLLMQTFLYFVNIFAAPVSGWIVQSKFLSGSSKAVVLGQPSPPSPIEFAVPELVKFILLLLIWFTLFYWLYLRPVSPEPAVHAPEPKPED